MKLKKLRLINIKSYYPEKEVSFEEDMNIFVGPNGGGKSNLFEILQGVINTLLYKHITLQQNPNWRDALHPERKKLFSLVFDNAEPTNIQQNIIDRHFQHAGDPGAVRMVFQITKEDIDQVKQILVQRDRFTKLLTEKIVGSEQVINLLNSTQIEDNFDEFIGKDIVLDVYPHESINLGIADYSGYDTDQQRRLNKLYEYMQFRNVFHELSLLDPILEIHPATRYFGPHRSIGQVQNYNSIDLSGQGNYEDSFAKGNNQNKENTPSFIDSSFSKICYLYKQGKNSVLDEYKRYLKKYLKVDFKIEQIEHPTKFVYDLHFNRISGVPMKLSSGEKEFFNLISGLLLAGIRNGIVLIDEPELHLHFQWQQTILNLIRELSREYSIQFFIVTHSPKFINQETLPRLFRVYMKDDLTSNIVKPDNPLANTELKDLVKFINTTNNEKAFFAHKVVLVEGISDLIVYTSIINKLKEKLQKDIEIEVIEVASKNNLFRFRKLLEEWEIENYIIGDLGFLKDVRKDKHQIKDSKISERFGFEALSSEINTLIKFSEDELKNILCKNPGVDAQTVYNLIKNKQSLTDKEFCKEINKISDYINNERAIKVDKSQKLSRKLLGLLNDLSNKENLLILREGNLEDVFTKLNTTTANKVINAIDVSEKIKLSDVPNYLLKFLTNIVNSNS